jgi:hypothetical protein
MRNYPKPESRTVSEMCARYVYELAKRDGLADAEIAQRLCGGELMSQVKALATCTPAGKQACRGNKRAATLKKEGERNDRARH